MVTAMKWGLLLVFLIRIVDSKRQDNLSLWSHCFPGERWTEDCRSCRCSSKGNVECGPKKQPCESECIYPSHWYSDKERCHCSSSRGGIICVPLKYENDLDNQPCPINGAQFFSDCISCYCIDGMTKCNTLPCGSLIGVCSPGETNLIACHECSCTFTMYHMCMPIYNCQQEKPGRCQKVESLNVRVYLWCTLNMFQKCRFDMECPGQQKCCLHENCYFICTDPIMEP